MQGTTHLTAGFLAGALVAQRAGVIAADPGGLALGLGVAGLAGLLPDWFQVNMPGLKNILRSVSGHRGISHWLLSALLVAWCVAVLLPGLWWAYVLCGWLSHIGLDIVSGGVPALWPITARIKLAHIKTGGKLDTLVGAACLALACIIVVGGAL